MELAKNHPEKVFGPYPMVDTQAEDPPKDADQFVDYGAASAEYGRIKEAYDNGEEY